MNHVIVKGTVRSTNKRRSNKAEQNRIRFRRLIPSQDPKRRVTGGGLYLLPSRRNEKRIDTLPDLLPKRADLFRRETPGTLTIQSLADFAVGEQTDD